MPGYRGTDPVHSTLLLGTSILNCAGGIVGGATPGVPRDTLFCGAYIAKNAGPASVTVKGFADSSGNAADLVITGSTSGDFFFDPPFPILNDLAALSFTPSVAGAVEVLTRSYTGP